MSFDFLPKVKIENRLDDRHQVDRAIEASYPRGENRKDRDGKIFRQPHRTNNPHP